LTKIFVWVLNKLSFTYKLSLNNRRQQYDWTLPDRSACAIVAITEAVSFVSWTLRSLSLVP